MSSCFTTSTAGILLSFGFLAGCSDTRPGFQPTTESQLATLAVIPGDAFVSLFDTDGDTIHMPDGIQVIMTNETYEEWLLPRLPRQLRSDPRTIVINSEFSLEKRSIVVGVVQSPDGDANDVSRTYWTYRPIRISSIELAEIAD